MKPLELYIHIPFCIQKCKYCDFLSAPSTMEERQEYVESLCQDICSYADMAKAYRVISIFIGGGTPSILEATQVEHIFAAICDSFSVDENAEITIEMNPGTVTVDKIAAYKKVGINRLSIGLQSVHNTELKTLGRIHTYEDFLETYQMARNAGFQNINIDLMSAIPGQTVDGWRETLEAIAKLEPEHISAYSLIIEEGTPFYEQYGEGEAARIRREKELPDEEAERQMYYDTKQILEENGYERYEISNYAKPGYECKHNLGYWERTEYLGIGTGASSLMDNRRWSQGEAPYELSKEEQMEEFMFLGLRKIKGISKTAFEAVFEVQIDEVYGTVIAKLKAQELLLEEEDSLRLTEKGIDISNYVMSEFLLD